MSYDKTGGQAFPMPATFNEGMGVHSQEYGMTLRDYFAGQAMQGFIVGADHPNGKTIATTAYEVADAMLAAREVQP